MLNKVTRRCLISSGCQNIKQMALGKCQRVGKIREDAVTTNWGCQDARGTCRHTMTQSKVSMRSQQSRNWSGSERGLGEFSRSGRTHANVVRQETACSNLLQRARTSGMALGGTREISSQTRQSIVVWTSFFGHLHKQIVSLKIRNSQDVQLLLLMEQ